MPIEEWLHVLGRGAVLGAGAGALLASIAYHIAAINEMDQPDYLRRRAVVVLAGLLAGGGAGATAGLIWLLLRIR